MTDGSRNTALWLAGLLGLCCVSVPALLGGTALVGGAAGATTVTTGTSGLQGLAVTLLVTAVTLGPVYAVWQWRG